MFPSIRRATTHDSILSNSSQRSGTRDSVSSTYSNERRPSQVKSSISLHTKLGSSLKIGRSRVDKSGTSEFKLNDSSKSWADLFFSLPNELQLQILLELPTIDILHCRATCQAFNTIVHVNESVIARDFINNQTPSAYAGLYPTAKPNLKYVIRMLHREIVSSKMSATVADFVRYEIMRIRSKSARRAFQADWDRIFRKMVPHIFTLYHFYESWRVSMLKLCSEKSSTVDDNNSLISNLLDIYSPESLLYANHMYCLLRHTLNRQLRPPTYETTFEKAFRGWRSKFSTSIQISKTLGIGGIDTVQQILSRKTLSERTKSVQSFLKAISPEESVKCQSNWQVLIYGPYATDEAPIQPLVTASWPELGESGPEWPFLATRKLISTGIIETINEVKMPRDFISELLGYDILTRIAVTTANGTENSSGDEDEDEAEGPPGGNDEASTVNWWD